MHRNELDSYSRKDMKFKQDTKRKTTMIGNLLNLMASKECVDKEYIRLTQTNDFIASQCYLCECEFAINEPKQAFNLDDPQDEPSNIFLGAWCMDCFEEFDFFIRNMKNIN